MLLLGLNSNAIKKSEVFLFKPLVFVKLLSCFNLKTLASLPSKTLLFDLFIFADVFSGSAASGG